MPSENALGSLGPVKIHMPYDAQVMVLSPLVNSTKDQERSTISLMKAGFMSEWFYIFMPKELREHQRCIHLLAEAHKSRKAICQEVWFAGLFCLCILLSCSFVAVHFAG